MGPASWSTHLPSTKILIWLALSGGRGEKLPWQWGEVCFGDGDGPQLGEAGWGKERKKLCTLWLLNHINGTLFNWLRCQKNWHQHIWGRYAWSKWEYDCEPCLRALSMFYQDCAIGVASKGLSVFASQELTVTLYIGRKLSVEEKYLMKCMPCVVQVTVREQEGGNRVLTQYLILLPLYCVQTRFSTNSV